MLLPHDAKGPILERFHGYFSCTRSPTKSNEIQNLAGIYENANRFQGEAAKPDQIHQRSRPTQLGTTQHSFASAGVRLCVA